MERAFYINSNTKFYKEYEIALQRLNHQKEIVKQFLKENNIEARKYYIAGDGIVNAPFEFRNKKNIRLGIIPTEKDIQWLDKKLNKPLDNGIRMFRKGNTLLKKFQELCVDNDVVINIQEPCPRNYFKSIGYKGYSYTQFISAEQNNCIYLKLESNCLDENELPEGFEEIKISYFYKKLEEYDK